MAKNLVIVESPHKTIPISAYLGKDYKVMASIGHIRDLSTKGKFGFGVDIENDFKPDYVTIKGKKKVIDELKKEAKIADKVYVLYNKSIVLEGTKYEVFKKEDELFSLLIFSKDLILLFCLDL